LYRNLFDCEPELRFELVVKNSSKTWYFPEKLLIYPVYPLTFSGFMVKLYYIKRYRRVLADLRTRPGGPGLKKGVFRMRNAVSRQNLRRHNLFPVAGILCAARRVVFLLSSNSRITTTPPR
jgi:hypothetical protein